MPLVPATIMSLAARGPAPAWALGLQSSVALVETQQSVALEPSGELETWQPSFEKTMLCLARSKRQEVYIPKLVGWAARSVHEFDGEAWHKNVVQKHALLGSDTYVSVHMGDWVAPSAWDFDGAEWHVKRDQGGWTHAKVWHLTDDVVVEGWLPGDLVDAAREKAVEITYAQLYLGWNDTPIPCPGRSVQPLPQFRKCHATLGYLAAMSEPQLNWAMKRGNLLIQKFWHDGLLPFYAFKPKVSENGTVVDGLCHFKVSVVARKSARTFNSFPTMLDGEVAQPVRFSRLPALFSDFVLSPGLPLIGSLDDRSHLFDLCKHLQHFLDLEVYGQPAFGTPFLTPDNSAWVSPHITLSPPLVADP